MVATSAIKAMIRENKVHSINNQIQLGATFGMQTLNQSPVSAVKKGLVTEEDAFEVSLDQEDFRKCMIKM
jgi:twitching motility protein PilT